MGMKIFKQWSDGFSALRLRDQIIAVTALALIIGLGGNVLLLKPQGLVIDSVRAKQTSVSAEMAEAKRALVSITSLEEKGIDPLAAERATLAELEGKIAQVTLDLGANFGAEDAGPSRVGKLVRELIKSSPGLSLVSLRTRPGVQFYSPPAPPPPPKEGAKREVEKVLATFSKDKPAEPVAPPAVLVNKPLYKHGVDVSVRGPYPALMAYLEGMQKFPQRIFWSEASLDATNYRDATLRLVVYTVSDQPVAPLN